MKKIISLIMTICMVMTSVPVAAYAASSTPEISLEEFTQQLQEIQSVHDGNYVSEIKIENGSEFCFVDGEENILTDSQGDATEAVVTDNDFEIPLSAISDYCDLPEISAYSLEESNDDINIDKETVEALGFEVEIEDDTAVLTQPYQTKRLIVKSEYGINPLDSVGIVEGYNDLHIVQFDNQESAKEAEEYYNSQKLIEYAEPDIVMSTMDIDYTVEESAVTSSSIKYDNHLSWGSESIGVDDYIDYLGDVSELPEITVGIIDTGIDLDHEFLQDRIIETGFNSSNSGTANNEDDDNGHGTHVAGIVADNTTENIKLKSFKCLNSNGNGELSNVVLAVDAAVNNKVDVINMSLGARTYSSTMEEAVNRAVDSGIIVCVSAGNSGADASKYSPANIEKCITVAAIDAYDSFPYWTNYGSCVDIAAPGVSIYSTYNDGNYKTLSGTSMASPFVAAASSMVLCKNINETPQNICDILRSNGRNCSPPSTFAEINVLYLGVITEYNGERTAMPQFNIESGKYSDNIIIEITCEDKNAEIYYTLDGTRASQDTGILYTEPINIDKVTSLHVAAYAPNKLKSLQAYADYYIVYTDPEENFEIDSDGMITAYNGTNNYLKIPDTIAGITVTGIGANVFNSSDIVMIKFPDTLTYVGERAFYFCRYLYSVDAKNIKYIAANAFARCTKLEQIDLTQAEVIETYGCYDLKSISSFYNDKVTTIEDNAFAACDYLISIDIPNAVKIGDYAFRNAYRLESLNVPKVETVGSHAFSYCKHIELVELNSAVSIGDYAFRWCSSLKNLYIPFVTKISTNAFFQINQVKTIFAPSLETITNLPTCDGVTLYLSDSFAGSDNPAYDYTIIAPSGSYAQQWAEENGYTFIPSDYREASNDKLDNTDDVNVRANGRSIRVTNTGLRFGFEWESIPEIEDLATDIDYGFIYHYNYDNEAFESSKLTVDNVGTDNVKIKKAVNLDDTNEGKTVFNLVFTNIPDKNQTTNISVRAYVCIDGMYFYSNTLNGSFGEVAGLVLADDEIDQNTKNAVNNLLAKEV